MEFPFAQVQDVGVWWVSRSVDRNVGNLEGPIGGLRFVIGLVGGSADEKTHSAYLSDVRGIGWSFQDAD